LLIARKAHDEVARMTVAEKQLACAVINLAIEDTLAPPPLARHLNYADRARIRSEALSFLTDKRGAWAEARHFWCMASDIDPDALRERTMLLCLADDETLRRRRRQLAEPEIAADAKVDAHIRGQFCPYPLNLRGGITVARPAEDFAMLPEVEFERLARGRRPPARHRPGADQKTRGEA
jgi:hypothetical protein